MELELQNEISLSLKNIKSVPIYREEVPQNFKTPSFMVLFDEVESSQGLNGRWKASVQIEVLYFPTDDSKQKNTECWTIGRRLRREFRMSQFKIKNRSLKITDNVLHFNFTVEFREFADMNDSQMQKMNQNYLLED